MSFDSWERWEAHFRRELVSVWGCTATLQGGPPMAQPALLTLYDPEAKRATERTPESPRSGHMAEPPKPTPDLREAILAYLDATEAAPATRAEYQTTLRKWLDWEKEGPRGPVLASSMHRSCTPMQVGQITTELLGSFLAWVYQQARADGSINPGRVHNKARAHLKAVLGFCCNEKPWIAAVPRMPADREQIDEAGLRYFSEAEVNDLYWATYRMHRPRGWSGPLPIGAYWRAALVFFYNYGVDTQTVFPYSDRAKPLRWRDVSWDRVAPQRQIKQECEWGWLFYRRVKTGRKFLRPMNREVHLHIRSIMPATYDPESPVFRGGGGRPCERFQQLIKLAGVKPNQDLDTGREIPWVLKDLRKTAATWHDENIPDSSVAILGHALGKQRGSDGVTHKHYASRDPLAFKAITTLPQPAAFRSIWDETIKPGAGLLFPK